MIGTIRDGWDIAVIVATLVTAGVALIGLLALVPVIRQLRRRPELAISWWFNGEPWGANDVAEIEPGASFRAGLGLTNVGDAGGESTLFNVILSDRFQLTGLAGQWGKQSGNPEVGGPCTYLKDERRFYVRLTWQYDFFVSAPDDPGRDFAGDYVLLFELSDDRLNASGQRIRWASSLRARKRLRIDASPELKCVVGARFARRTIRRIARIDPNRAPGARLASRSIGPPSHEPDEAG